MQVMATCELANLTTAANGTLRCNSGWQYKEAFYPMYELTLSQTSSLMAATAFFLVICWIGRTMIRSAQTNGQS
jgi:hypothetical protein